MNQLISGNISNVKMTSREIADLVESRHDSVKRTIETLITKGVIGSPQSCTFKNGNNVEGREYVFSGAQGERDAGIVVARLSSKSPTKGAVYGLEFGGHLKIGFSCMPKERHKQLRRLATYAGVDTGKICISPMHTNPRKTEQQLHKLYDPYRVAGTELFDVSLHKFEQDLSHFFYH